MYPVIAYKTRIDREMGLLAPEVGPQGLRSEDWWRNTYNDNSYYNAGGGNCNQECFDNHWNALPPSFRDGTIGQIQKNSIKAKCTVMCRVSPTTATTPTGSLYTTTGDATAPPTTAGGGSNGATTQTGGMGRGAKIAIAVVLLAGIGFGIYYFVKKK